ncbi:hypothetical protein FKM82_019717 [Ascaphus truei]
MLRRKKQQDLVTCEEKEREELNITSGLRACETGWIVVLLTVMEKGTMGPGSAGNMTICLSHVKLEAKKGPPGRDLFIYLFIYKIFYQEVIH